MKSRSAAAGLLSMLSSSPSELCWAAGHAGAAGTAEPPALLLLLLLLEFKQLCDSPVTALAKAPSPYAPFVLGREKEGGGGQLQRGESQDATQRQVAGPQ